MSLEIVSNHDTMVVSVGTFDFPRPIHLLPKPKSKWPRRPLNAPYTPNVRDVWADVSEEEAQT